ncbi:MAG: hypothetical protein KY449_05900 [Proteobacteria bacterium]|nr:hypothetical protein [Pseudomonadota bacterium]
MKHLLLAAGAAALALALPATAALADGYNARPAYMQAKPKPKAKPRAQAKPAAKPVKQARHKPRVHRPKTHGYAAAHVQYEELETVETSFTQEVNGYVSGPYTSYSERYIAPHHGCHPQAPCGYSRGTPYVDGAAYGYGAQHGSAYGYGYGHGGTTMIQPGFHHGALTGGVGYGVDGGPVFSGGNVFIVPGGRFSPGARVTRFGGSSASAHSSAQAYGSASYGYGVHGGTYGHGFGYGPTPGYNAGGYLGFKPSVHGQGIGTTGYGGFRR